MLKILLMKVVAAGGGAAAGSVAGPLGTLGGAVVSMVRVQKVLIDQRLRWGWGWTSQSMLEWSL